MKLFKIDAHLVVANSEKQAEMFYKNEYPKREIRYIEEQDLNKWYQFMPIEKILDEDREFIHEYSYKTDEDRPHNPHKASLPFKIIIEKYNKDLLKLGEVSRLFH